jgi:hypothetical protein
MQVLDSAVNEFRKRGLNISLDDVLGTKTKAVLGSDTAAKWRNIYDALAKADPQNSSKWEAQRDKVSAAGQRINQLMAGQINAYYKEHAGAAVTVIELPRLQEYAGGNLTADKLRNFLDNESRKYAAEERTQFLQLSPAAQAMWLTRKGTDNPRLEGPNVRKYEGPEAPEAGRSPKGSPKVR